MITTLMMATACSQGDVVPKENQTESQRTVPKKSDSLLQPQMNILKKAKDLEKKLKEAEEKRLNMMEDFER